MGSIPATRQRGGGRWGLLIRWRKKEMYWRRDNMQLEREYAHVQIACLVCYYPLDIDFCRHNTFWSPK
jgi:hypothetical protein